MKQSHVSYAKRLQVYFPEKIKNTKISDLVKYVNEFKKLSKNKNIRLPTKFKDYKSLIDPNNIKD